MTAPVFLTERQVAARYGIHQNTVRNWVASGRIVQPLVLSPGCVRWRLSDIERWEDEKAAQTITAALQAAKSRRA